jgi:hypothetical protein
MGGSYFGGGGVGLASVPDTYLTAGPGTNLAAVDDGETWAGANNLLLPFP